MVLQGKSPTMEMLFDWGTTDCSVGDLVEILLRHQLLAAVSVLLPNHSSRLAAAGAQLSTASLFYHWPRFITHSLKLNTEIFKVKSFQC